MESIYSIAVSLFLVLDPLGNVPFFLTILKGYSARRRQWIIMRESLFALVTMVIFLSSALPSSAIWVSVSPPWV